jgi:hypothetical protein
MLLDLNLLNIYKEHLGLQPAEVQLYMGIISIPWSFRVLYGFLSDNIYIFSSRRRNHILINSFINIVAMSLVMKYGMQEGKYYITSWLFLSQMNMAYCDTVTDALSVQATKHQITGGNENL